MSSAAAAGVKVDTKPPARLHAGRYRHADQLLRRRPGPSLHRSGALEPRQGMLLNNRRPASFRPPARNRNQTSDQKVGSCKSLIRASDQTFRLNPAGGDGVMSTHVVLRLYLGQLVGWLVDVTIQKPCCNQWWTVQVLTIRWLDESAAASD